MSFDDATVAFACVVLCMEAFWAVPAFSFFEGSSPENGCGFPLVLKERPQGVCFSVSQWPGPTLKDSASLTDCVGLRFTEVRLSPCRAHPDSNRESLV